MKFSFESINHGDWWVVYLSLSFSLSLWHPIYRQCQQLSLTDQTDHSKASPSHSKATSMQTILSIYPLTYFIKQKCFGCNIL